MAWNMIARRVGQDILAAAVASAAACSDTTAPVRRFAVLDDVGESDWAAVSAGGDHTCALKTNGTAYCWGSNEFGQLGTSQQAVVCGTSTHAYPCSLAPQAVETSLKFASISAGQRHTCGITLDHRAFCWGANDANQVSTVGPGGPAPIETIGALPWVQISAGYTHTCAVRSDGVLFCWGSNDRGQIGNGTFTTSVGVTRVPVSSPIASVATGQSRTCARTTTGSVLCWGAIWTDTENGLEFTRAQLTPQSVPQAPHMAGLSVGAFTTCGTDLSGAAYCWEANPRGEMGTGTVDGSTIPLPVLGNLQFVQITAGILQTCGIVTSGAAYCWGDDSFGQLGVSSSVLVERCSDAALPCATKPVAVVGRQQFTELSTGLGSHACGVTVKGNLYCWGLDVSGQLGDGGTFVGISTPLRVMEPAAPKGS
jgi:alpha-tubulin suppressor-like RCC1 family protein